MFDRPANFPLSSKARHSHKVRYTSLLASILAVALFGMGATHVADSHVVGKAKTAARSTVAKIKESKPHADGELLQDISVETSAPVVLASYSPDAPAHESKPVVAKHHVIWMEVTAYCACTQCCGPNASGLTASGKDVSYNESRFAAADTDVLPFGTKLSIPGYASEQPVEVIDRGGAIKGNRLDVFFATHEQAVEWGRQWVAVTVAH